MRLNLRTFILAFVLVTMLSVGTQLNSVLHASPSSSLVVYAFTNRVSYITDDPAKTHPYDVWGATTGGLGMPDKKFVNAVVLYRGKPQPGATVKFSIYSSAGVVQTVSDPILGDLPGDTSTERIMVEWDKVKAPGHYGRNFLFFPDGKPPGDLTVWRVKVTAEYGGYTATCDVTFRVFIFGCSKHNQDWDTAATKQAGGYGFHVWHTKYDTCSDDVGGVGGCHEDQLIDKGLHRTRAGYTCLGWTTTKKDMPCHGPVVATQTPTHYWPGCTLKECHVLIGVNHTLKFLYTRTGQTLIIDGTSYPGPVNEMGQRPCYYCHTEAHNTTNIWKRYPETPGCTTCHPYALALVTYVIPFILPVMGVIASSSSKSNKFLEKRASTRHV